MTPTEMILTLLQDGHKIATEAENNINIQKSEALARRAIGYFDAANVLLNAFVELHNDLIDNPLFVAARRFCRKFRLS